ncbi:MULTISPECIES: rod shape-determining protein MreD [Staphylococcus]|uniref:Rod shape-determining protein MreD n=1 Tax=Staphylococcus hsinchuensis TaxID=3051183 RepID=A0ABZ3ECU6_9STAP|nr:MULTISPECIES: rod shape-determining protein MreD [unclassified Staphylococcus]
MRTLSYFLIGLILFYIDTIIGLVIPMQINDKAIIFVPHLTLMYLLMLCIYRSFGVSIVLSIILGLMADLYFGSFYGLYLFGYILLVVMMDFFFKTFYRDHGMIFIVVLFGTMVFEVYSGVIYSILGIVDMNVVNFILFRMIPTFILNFILLLILFPIIKKFTSKMQFKIDSKNS